jgi:hypothetical protein
MRYESGSAVLPNVFLNGLLTNSKTSAHQPSSPSRHWLFGYVPSVPFAIKRLEERDDSLEWAAEHFAELLEKHNGEWVLVRDHRVVDSSPDSTELLKRAVAQGIKKPLMLWVEAPPPPGLDAFVAYGG